MIPFSRTSDFERGTDPFTLALHQSRELFHLSKGGGEGFPRSLKADGSVRLVPPENWTSGFFPGILWMLFDIAGKDQVREFAETCTERLKTVQAFRGHHDIGFIINCSFGHGYRITQKPEYREVIIEAARSLLTRFRPSIGFIQSLEPFDHWRCPVLVDNLMNLELLFVAHTLTDDEKFYEIAAEHAQNTLKTHYRTDGSCYHLVDFEEKSGRVLERGSHQGLNAESVWARGQAWGVYGCTMVYRFTGDKRFLDQAVRSSEYLLSHKNVPADGVPYWDYNAPGPDPQRDSSAAAVLTSALYELAGFSTEKRDAFSKAADTMAESLSSGTYLAGPGENGYFLLKHGIGNRPAGKEIDVPLIYGDYYYLEALLRKKREGNSVEQRRAAGTTGTAGTAGRGTVNP